MKNLSLSLLSLLTASLSLSSTSPQTAALDAWADKHVPILIDQAKACLTGPFSLAEVGVLAESAVMAAQDLKGVFVGTERAKIAQTVLVYAVQEVLPDSVESWVLPLLEGEGITRLIEATFRKLFGTEAAPAEGTAPVVDASDVVEGGVQ